MRLAAPTRNSSRREYPSQVRPGRPGIDNIAAPCWSLLYPTLGFEGISGLRSCRRTLIAEITGSGDGAWAWVLFIRRNPAGISSIFSGVTGTFDSYWDDFDRFVRLMKRERGMPRFRFRFWHLGGRFRRCICGCSRFVFVILCRRRGLAGGGVWGLFWG